MIGQVIRIYPTKDQERFLEELCGFSRHAYNMMLAKKQEDRTLSFRQLRDWYKQNKEPWTQKYSNMIIDTASEDLASAYQRFFTKQNRFPSFKTKKRGLHFSLNAKNNYICCFKDGYVFLNKQNHIRVSEDLRYTSPMSYTFSKKSDQWFISINFKDEVSPYTKTNKSCGIDVGLKTEITVADSDNKCFKKELDHDKIAHFKKSRKYYQKILEKKKKESKSYQKTLNKIQTTYRKQNNYITDFYKKSVYDLVKNYDAIGIEDLNIKGMMKNRRVSHSFQMKSLRKFLSILQAKAKLVGKSIIIVDRFFASSQICSSCGEKNPSTKNLSVREWTCEKCGAHHDRDENAAKNIMKHILSPSL